MVGDGIYGIYSLRILPPPKFTIIIYHRNEDDEVMESILHINLRQIADSEISLLCMMSHLKDSVI